MCSILLFRVDLDKLSLHSHLCRCGPPKSSSGAWSFDPRTLCSGPCGWFSVLGPDSCGTLWTLAGPYLVLADACGPACPCHGKSCTSAQLLSDSHDLARKNKRSARCITKMMTISVLVLGSYIKLHEKGLDYICFAVGQRAFSWPACAWKACLDYLTSPVTTANKSV